MGDLAKHHIKHNHKHGTVDELRKDLNNINNHSTHTVTLIVSSITVVVMTPKKITR
jgi:molybdopterin-guanine dinucleotide biosynthesis protein